MEKSSTVTLAVLLVIGLIVGAGAGYFLAPPKIEVETIIEEKHPLDGKTVTFGYIAPHNLEPQQSFIEDFIAEEINAYVETLGIDVTFEWIFEDANESEIMHLAKVEALHSQGVDIFVGGSQSSMAETALDYVNMNDMLMVSRGSTNQTLEIEDDNLYRFMPLDLVQVKALAHMLMSWGIEHVALADGGWYEDFSEAFTETYESLGGEILGISLDNEELDTLVGEAITQYGSERVGVAALLWVPSFIIADTAYYENLGNVLYMGLGEQVQPFIIDEVGGQQTKLRMFGAWPSTSASSRWSGFVTKYEEVMGGSPPIWGDYLYDSIWEGATYDAIWCMVLSVLQSGSADPMKVKEVLPDVAAKYYGVTGACTLNSAGDRVPHIYDIWGYAQIDGEHTYLKYGEYNAQTDQVQWFDSALSSQNLIRPGS